MGGVLYPPNILPQEVFNEKVFMKICFNSDDIWLKAMSLLNGVLCKGLPSQKVFIIKGTQKQTLWKQNILNNRNNTALNTVFKHYNLYPLFAESKKIDTHN